ncbi:hypothetical protein [Olivibacter domesticus]|uniref:hypothetical protein n=1 Tax=Olivibacter domesticus TaxID=407022 RepID=UPI00192E48F3|nr:hypothetical protein [Olivibacter domesticus]
MRERQGQEHEGSQKLVRHIQGPLVLESSVAATLYLRAGSPAGFVNTFYVLLLS